MSTHNLGGSNEYPQSEQKHEKYQSVLSENFSVFQYYLGDWCLQLLHHSSDSFETLQIFFL